MFVHLWPIADIGESNCAG